MAVLKVQQEDGTYTYVQVGPKGDKGDIGPIGPQGPVGSQGIKGDIGPAGKEGPIGPQGIQGLKGDTGLQGPQGIQGLKGDRGPQGLQGLKGDIGPIGPKGEDAPDLTNGQAMLNIFDLVVDGMAKFYDDATFKGSIYMHDPAGTARQVADNEGYLYDRGVRVGDKLSDITSVSVGDIGSLPYSDNIVELGYCVANIIKIDELQKAHKAAKASSTAYGHVQHFNSTLKIPLTGWVGTEAPYTQTITVPGITASDSPIIDIVLSGIYIAQKVVMDEYNKIYRAETLANGIKFYASHSPVVELTVQVKVVR